MLVATESQGDGRITTGVSKIGPMHAKRPVLLRCVHPPEKFLLPGLV